MVSSNPVWAIKDPASKINQNQEQEDWPGNQYLNNEFYKKRIRLEQKRKTGKEEIIQEKCEFKSKFS